MGSLQSLTRELENHANPQKGKILSGFFKTGKGEYAEGDLFLGLTVPQQRTIIKKYLHLPLSDLQKLLNSKIHEHRFCALAILVSQFQKVTPNSKEAIFNFYLKNTQNINNWDLVDCSAPKIVGEYLLNRDKSILYKLAGSKNLWDRRIAILSTSTFINKNQFTDTIKIAEILLKDKHDLIHKAVGWMLREVGKKDQKLLEEFLQFNCQKMPRVMLCYALEKFSQEKRRLYLNK